jgi:hypothetical protein
MSEPQSPLTVRWSTENVPRSRRADYFVEALSSLLVPMRAAIPDPATFSSRMNMVDLGPLALISQSGSAHSSHRGAAEIARSGARTFHLIINRAAPGTLDHCGRNVLAQGDVVLMDTGFAHDFEWTTDWEVVNIRLTEAWMQRWLPDAGALIGHKIPDSGWGQALMSYVSQLSPKRVLGSPLPKQVICDQLGTLLALTAREFNGGAQQPKRGEEALRSRIKDCIVERCSEPLLTANDIAASLDIAPEEVHQCLAAFGETFGDALTSTRTDIAIRMLSSPLFEGISAAEIGRRVGFPAAAQFKRVLRSRPGLPARTRNGNPRAALSAIEVNSES